MGKVSQNTSQKERTRHTAQPSSTASPPATAMKNRVVAQIQPVWGSWSTG